MTESSNGLFRDEALAARSNKLKGEILLPRAVGSRALVLALIIASLLIGGVVAFGSYPRIEAAKGVLATSIQIGDISASHSGTVYDIWVKEGQKVKKGQPLLRVQVEQSYARGSRATEESLSALAQQQGFAIRQIKSSSDEASGQIAGLSEQINNLRQQQENLDDQIVIQTKSTNALSLSLERYHTIASAGFIAKSEIERREQEVLMSQQALLRLQQAQSVFHGEELKARSELSRVRAQAASIAAAMESSAAGLLIQKSQLKAQQSYIVSAPVEGVVTALQTGIGRTVEASTPLMAIMPPNASVYAEVLAPSRAVGFVKPGQSVRLMYDAFPYERFGSFNGRVRTVSKVALNPSRVTLPIRVDEPVYLIAIDVDEQFIRGYGDNVRLQPGMTLTANIILENRSFVGWLLQPLRAVTSRSG